MILCSSDKGDQINKFLLTTYDIPMPSLHYSQGCQFVLVSGGDENRNLKMITADILGPSTFSRVAYAIVCMQSL